MSLLSVETEVCLSGDRVCSSVLPEIQSSKARTYITQAALMSDPPLQANMLLLPLLLLDVEVCSQFDSAASSLPFLVAGASVLVELVPHAASPFVRIRLLVCRLR
jgi:hypothetical protein